MRYNNNNNNNFAKRGLNQKSKFCRVKNATILLHAEQIGTTKAYHRWESRNRTPSLRFKSHLTKV